MQNEDSSAISKIDEQLVELFLRRVELVKKLSDAGQLPAVWDHITDTIDRFQKCNSQGVAPSKDLIADVARQIASATIASVGPWHRVVFLGPIYSYSYLAAVEHFGPSAQLDSVGTISAVFDAVIRKQATSGIVPIENSTDGRIVDTLSLFAKLPVQICGEVVLPIHHCLLARCRRDEIEVIYSKPQAISQCRLWLSEHLPNAKLVEVSSTATAAEYASHKDKAAAIASQQAGVHNGLNVIVANIEDNQHNSTRFAIIGDHEPEPTGNDKTSLLMQLHHRAGTLAEAMQCFQRGGINLTWIESFPIPGVASEYLFFVEFEGHRSTGPVAKTLDELKRLSVRLDILGSFPKAKTIH